VLKNLEIDNFTRVTCISYSDLVENLFEKFARINNKKTVYANSLVTAHSFRDCLCCCIYSLPVVNACNFLNQIFY